MLKLSLSTLPVLAGAAVMAQSPWKQVSMQLPNTPDLNPEVTALTRFATFKLSQKPFANSIAQAPLEGQFGSRAVIELPMPNGTTQKFSVVEAPILSDELARRIPIKTYVIQGIDDPYAHGRVDFGLYGFHGMILSPNGDVIIDPVRRGDVNHYLVYNRSAKLSIPGRFTCSPDLGTSLKDDGSTFGIMTTGPTLKSYRLALNATTEYTTYYGSVALAEAGATTSINRVVGVYEVDCAIRMNIVFLKCWTGTDPFSNSSGSTMLGQNQTNLDSVVGNANYDIGHVFSTGGGGVAGLRVVGVTGSKARGVTGSGAPVGDGFDIDYVAHEMGHQYGGNHSFNGTTSSCGGGNRNASTAWEMGSGSTIMAYAGICGAEDLQPHSDAYFHTGSIDEIVSWRNNAGSGGSSTNTGNGAPSVNAGLDYSIPLGTPFVLTTASSSDPDNDPLTFCWEQTDVGTASPTTNNATRPLFRSFSPTTTNKRFCPKLADVLSGAATPWEILPTVARNLNFRCTVRDNRAGGGGVEQDSMRITVTSGAAMAVASPNTAVTLFAGSPQTVTWTVGGSSAISPNVNIRLSTNGGLSYGTGTSTLLAANVPNTGTANITLPNVATTQARIFVEAASSIFYDVSNVNFTIVQPVISGSVTRQFFAGSPTSRQVTFEIRNVGSTTPIQTVTTNLTAGGTFSFVGLVPGAGNYDITCKSTNWLRSKRTPVSITTAGATGQNFTLTNGDCNDDNNIDLGDFDQLALAFGSSFGDANYTEGADLNGDNVVDLGDFDILAGSFGLDGTP